MKARGFLVIGMLLLVGFAFSAGCTSSQSPQDISATTLPVSLTSTLIPAVSSVSPALTVLQATTGTPVQTGIVTASLPAATPTWIQKSSVAGSAEDPHIALLDFTPEYLSFRIPDCGMRAVFPQAATDKKYGIRQSVPKLIAITPAQLNAFMASFAQDADSDPNLIGGSTCEGAVVTPTWNFVQIRATLIPRNARPTEYDIGINVRSEGKVVEQFRMSKTFILDETVPVELYVPLKTGESDAFDSVELVFAKRG